MKKAIVTGATGYLGLSFVSMLLERGIDVVAVGRSRSIGVLPKSALLTIVKMDFLQAKESAKCLPEGEYDAFYHFAWQGVNGADKADPMIQSRNMQMALSCARLAKEIGCKRFLCAGTVAERAVESLPFLEKTSGGMLYGTAKHCTHLMLEAHCKSIGLPFVWMQFSNIYGPGNKTGNLVSYTLTQIIKGEPACFGPAEQPYDFLYIDDLLEALIRLGEQETPNSYYYIGSGAPRILKDYLYTIGRICGKEDLIRIGVRSDDGIRYSFDMFDTKPLTACIGDYVAHSFEDGIRRTIEAF